MTRFEFIITGATLVVSVCLIGAAWAFYLGG